jgi:hypothetical protein
LAGLQAATARPVLAQPSQLPPETAAMIASQRRLMKEAAPDFYAYQEKIEGLEAKMAEVMARYAKNEIDREAAKDELGPLIEEEQATKNNLDYLIEQKLAQAVFSSPKFQEKLSRISRRFAKAMPAPAPARTEVRR